MSRYSYLLNLQFMTELLNQNEQLCWLCTEYKIKETANDCSIRLFLMQLDFALMLTTLLWNKGRNDLHVEVWFLFWGVVV